MKNIKRILVAVLVASMILPTSFSVGAQNKRDGKKINTNSASYTKSENVYANLETDGTAKDAYVVNHFSVNRKGNIVDYGNYDEIKNLTTLDSLANKNKTVTFQANDGEFYYQGQIKNVELPWKFSISYELDGKSVTADEIAGKSGKIKITFKSVKNNKVNKNFYNNYLMQVSATLDSEKVKNIVADGATMADAGSKRQLSFTSLPGSDAKFVIKADVNDFTMSGFSIAAVPYSMDVDMDQFNMDDFSGQISELTDAVDKLNEGADNLSNGINKLCGGNEKLLDGSKDIKNGLNKLNSNSENIISASSKIKKALNKVSIQLDKADFSEMSKLSELPGGLKQLADALDGVANGLKTLEANYSKALSTLDQMMQANADIPTEKELNALQKCVKDDDEATSAYRKLMASYKQLLTIKGTYDKIKPAFEAVQTTLSSKNEQSVVKGIGIVSGELLGMAKSLSDLSKTDIAGQMEKLKKGISTLAKQYGKFDKGLSSYTAGVDTLSNNYGNFHKGLSSYVAGNGKIGDGAADLTNGMKQFANGVSDMPTQIQNTIDEMIGSFSGDDYQAVSFTDTKNDNIGSVQFVISTKAIEKNKEEKTKDKEKKEGFWDRLKELFF